MRKLSTFLYIESALSLDVQNSSSQSESEENKNPNHFRLSRSLKQGQIQTYVYVSKDRLQAISKCKRYRLQLSTLQRRFFSNVKAIPILLVSWAYTLQGYLFRTCKRWTAKTLFSAWSAQPATQDAVLPWMPHPAETTTHSQSSKPIY